MRLPRFVPNDPENPHIVFTKAERARKKAVAGYISHVLKDQCKGNQDIRELDYRTETLFNDAKIEKMNLWEKLSLDIFSGHSPTVDAYRVKKAKLEFER